MTLLDHWPVLSRYTGAGLRRLAMPVGGIGTGCISLGGRGQLTDWELFNRPAKGFSPDSFFCVRTAQSSRSATRVLEVALADPEVDGPHGSRSALHGLPRFRTGEFAAAYPFGQVRMSDPDVPVEATIGAFNPLVPGDADASGIPALVYRVRLRNTSAEDVTAAVCGSMQNVVGREAGSPLPSGNRFEAFRAGDARGLRGVSTQVPAHHEAWGSLGLAVLGEEPTSTRLNWAHRSWGDSLLDFWDDLAADGDLTEPEEGARVPTGSLVVTRDLGPGAVVELTFLVTWHFPNLRGWADRRQEPPNRSHDDDIVGNHYATRFRDAADVAGHLASHLPDYEGPTLDYVRTVVESDLPQAVQDAALSNTAVLKSPTCFRIADGTFLAWEGCNPDSGSCHGSCTHVWNYQYALEQLFPDLAWTMREVEFVHSLDERGLMSFRTGLPLATHGTDWRVGAADGQMGTVLRLFRTWQLTGDDDRLRSLWPEVRRAMAFAWIPLGWDADADGVMEGCQHSTEDVEFYGPNGVNQGWYLATLAACAEMAEYAGDTDFARRCSHLVHHGASWTDAELFNGEYYEQRVLPPGSADQIAEGLRIRYDSDNPDAGSDDLEDPDLQIGSGCTSDQLAGHAMGVMCQVDDGLDPGQARTAMRSVVRHNRREEFYSHFNHLRTFAVNDERGLLNCTFPRGDRPARPFPYYSEVWTGWEYTAAVMLALNRDRDLAEQTVRDVRDRHDGRRRNPFNEVECGNHYARSMASYGLLHAWAHTVVDARSGTLWVDALPGRWPVVAGVMLGTVEVTEHAGEVVAAYRATSGPSPRTVVVRSPT